VLWRHCHGEHCEAHAMHTEEECQLHQHSSDTNTKFKVVTEKSPSISKHIHSHQHDSGRSGMMIMVGDTFHNFVDGILIAAAFMIDIRLGAVTAMAIIAHEIPQEVGDFLILLHSGYSKNKLSCLICSLVLQRLLVVFWLTLPCKQCKAGCLQFWD